MIAVIDAGPPGDERDPRMRVLDVHQPVSTHASAVGELVHACAPGAEVLAVSVKTPTGNDAAAAVHQSLHEGADVILLSIGTPIDGDELRAAVSAAERDGVVVVAPAGNSARRSPILGEDQPPPLTEWNEAIFPAAYESVLAVGALHGKEKPADFSQEHAYVDVSAPGVTIPVMVDGRERLVTGASYAAPVAAAAAAMVFEVHPDWTPAAVREAVKRATHDVGDPGPDPKTGAGRIDLGTLRSV